MFTTCSGARPVDPFHLGSNLPILTSLSPASVSTSSIEPSKKKGQQSDDAITVDCSPFRYEDGSPSRIHVAVYEGSCIGGEEARDYCTLVSKAFRIQSNSLSMTAGERVSYREEVAVAMDRVRHFATSVKSNMAPAMDKAIHLVYKALCSHVYDDPNQNTAPSVASSLADIDAMTNEERHSLRKEELAVFSKEFEQLTKDALDILSIACDITRQGLSTTLNAIVASVDGHVRPLVQELITMQGVPPAHRCLLDPISHDLNQIDDNPYRAIQPRQWPRCRIDSFPFEQHTPMNPSVAVTEGYGGIIPSIHNARQVL